jgi:AcrR family transcriptional regulator
LLVSTPYEGSGRTGQKKRTREALVVAARELVSQGLVPTIEEAAAAAEISRTTAYRYFPNQRALLGAAHPETAARSLLPDNPPADPGDRLDAAVVTFTALVLGTEAQQRTMLRLSLEADRDAGAPLPLRQGRAIAWFAEAVAPLNDRMSDAQLHRLVLAIRSAVGIEALVWLTDIAGLSSEQAVEVMRWSASALLRSAIDHAPPPVDVPTKGGG